jgi:methionine-rich copper-binding protein CopC
MKSNSLLKSVAALATSAFLVLIPTAAFANSITSQSPTAGANISVAPSAVTITTAETLAMDGNSITVLSPNGDQVDDGSLTINANQAVIGLKALTTTGVYTVTYNLLVDNEAPLAGSYTFFFTAPGGVTTPTAAPTPSTTQSTVTSGSSTGTTALVIVLLVAAFGVFLFLIYYAKKTFGAPKKRLRK